MYIGRKNWLACPGELAGGGWENYRGGERRCVVYIAWTAIKQDAVGFEGERAKSIYSRRNKRANLRMARGRIKTERGVLGN